MRACGFGVAAALCLSVCSGTAVAEEFSIVCTENLPPFYYTFDDQEKRVIAYLVLDDHATAYIFTGTIKAISAEEIRFDLSMAFNSNAKLGDFVLNRKDGRVTGSNWRGEAGHCQPTPLRTVMDLWEIFPHDP
jgi:hypothetical protein